MAQHICWSCGTGYDGANCPVCILRKQSEKSADQATRDQERATAATERAFAEQTREIAEALERANEADAQNAYETQMAIERAAEENRRAKADEWKLQSRSKSDQARKLKDSGMLSDALELALQAIQQDRGNLDGYAVAADVLNEQGQYDPAKVYIEKQIQLLSHSDYRTEPENFLRVLYKIGSDDVLRCMVCQAIDGNIEYWDWPDIHIGDRAESIAEKVSSWKQFKTALAVQRWLLRKSGFTAQRLTSIRKLVLAAAGSPAGVGPLRKELEELARWLSGEDKGDDSRMFQYAEKRRPLATLVLAEEIYALLGTKRQLLHEFLQRLKITNSEKNCEKLEEDLSELSKLSAQGDFAPDAFPRVQQEVAEKYSTWQQDIQEQVYAKVKAAVDAKPMKTHGNLIAFVVWCILAFVAQFIPRWSNGGSIQRMNPTIAFGSLLGAILFGMACNTVEKSFRYYSAMRDAVAEAVTTTNRRFGTLGLPTIQAPPLKVHPPRLSIVVYAVLLCSYFGWWFHAIAPSSMPNDGEGQNQVNVTESQVQPSSNINANEQRIDGVSAVIAQQVQTITITGIGFGQTPAYLGDSDFLQVSDLTRDWNAGWSRSPGTDKVGLKVTSWTDTKIVIEGFTGAYASGQWSLGEGDNIRFRVWNPQTGQGPAAYASVVTGTATQKAGGSPSPSQ